MHSTAKTVDIYLDEAPSNRQAALRMLRELCRAKLSDYEESMDYGMPSYRRAGEDIEVAFASQARYISIYILRQAILDRHRTQLSTANLGKGCIRYSNPQLIDFDVVATMLQQSTLDTGPVC